MKASIALLAVFVLLTGCINSIDQIKEACTQKGSFTGETASISQVRSKFIQFMDKYYVLQGEEGLKTVINNVSTESNMYAVNYSIMRVTDEIGGGKAFVSLDGKYLIPNALDFDKTLLELESMITEQEQTPAQGTTTTIPKSDKPVVLLFTMSYCPYGNQAEDGIWPAVKLLNNSITFEPHYVIYNSNFGYQGSQYCLDNESKYCSMHGIQELNQDVRELCVFKYSPEKFWDFVNAANTQCTYQNVDTCWKGVAGNIGLNVTAVESCYSGEATTLLANEVLLNDQYEARGSPYVIINGQSYSGGRTPEAFKQAICGAFNTPPAECGNTLSTTGAAASGGCG
jgi:hypothetical protein